MTDPAGGRTDCLARDDGDSSIVLMLTLCYLLALVLFLRKLLRLLARLKEGEEFIMLKPMNRHQGIRDKSCNGNALNVCHP